MLFVLVVLVPWQFEIFFWFPRYLESKALDLDVTNLTIVKSEVLDSIIFDNLCFSTTD